MARRRGPQETKGKTKVWTVHNGVWQMRDCYGNAARNFRRTRNGMNFAPNQTTAPHLQADKG